jgi:hypothetical protein
MIHAGRRIDPNMRSSEYINSRLGAIEMLRELIAVPLTSQGWQND